MTSFSPPLPLTLLIRLMRLPWSVSRRLLLLHPYFAFVRETASTQTPATLENWLTQHALMINRGPYWPVHHSSLVDNWRNIVAGVETSPGLMPGCYISAIGPIHIGDYTQIAAQVGIISANHVLEDNRKHDVREVRIGAYGWLGMGCVILPDVILGDFTIVGAGSIVTHSFPEGHCVLAGTPARVIKRLDPEKCVRHTSEHEYHGYIPKRLFPEFRKKFLRV
jgi:acetyltransferase-like isoleucine patch superfamily enzyme